MDTKYCKIKSICLWKKPSWAIKRMVELFYLLVFDIRPRSYCTYIWLNQPLLKLSLVNSVKNRETVLLPQLNVLDKQTVGKMKNAQIKRV